jgi:E3 ubiquitin-protein ligase SHPRH
MCACVCVCEWQRCVYDITCCRCLHRRRSQWVDELAKHIAPGTLSLRVYVGQSQLSAGAAPDSGAPPRTAAGARAAATAAVVTSAAAAAAAAGRVITAADLAAADIVLTTYDVLSRELALQPGEDEAAGRTMRQRKRYAVVPTPLTRLSFWRLVLDEAQAVRGSTARASAMARRIRAEHRWAVTGVCVHECVHVLMCACLVTC